MYSYRLSKKLVERLTENSLKISFAESCTGGLAAAALTSIPGAAAVINESYITYANSSKHKLLGVSKSTFDLFGAVSWHCASEMAFGLLKASGSDIAVSITGLAGPGGGSVSKPVGTVFLGGAIKMPNGKIKIFVRKYNFPKHYDRKLIRSLSVKAALKLSHFLINLKVGD